MREILFRGKTEKGEWVQGDLLHPDLYGNGCAIEDFTKEKNNCFDVIPETVGQFTGLTDKNGTKIFEGDIVEYDEEYGCTTYDENEARFAVHFDTWMTDFDHLYSNELEVVGNIHDNPELLKGGAE